MCPNVLVHAKCSVQQLEDIAVEDEGRSYAFSVHMYACQLVVIFCSSYQQEQKNAT
jgi:hypothetical protein